MTTPLQNTMLKAIARSELTCINGAEPSAAQETVTWANCVIETAADKGVFTSLLNAGLVWHEGNGRDAQVGLTDAGLAAYKAIPK